jgi:hypothetical protein
VGLTIGPPESQEAAQREEGGVVARFGPGRASAALRGPHTRLAERLVPFGTQSERTKGAKNFVNTS